MANRPPEPLSAAEREALDAAWRSVPSSPNDLPRFVADLTRAALFAVPRLAFSGGEEGAAWLWHRETDAVHCAALIPEGVDTMRRVLTRVLDVREGRLPMPFGIPSPTAPAPEATFGECVSGGCAVCAPRAPGAAEPETGWLTIPEDEASVLVAGHKMHGSGFSRLHLAVGEMIAQRSRALSAERERDELSEKWAAQVAGDTTIERLVIESGRFELDMSGDGPRVLSAALIQLYRSGGGHNYLEMHMMDTEKNEQFAVTVQRVGGVTPHQARVAAEAALAKAESRCAAALKLAGEAVPAAFYEGWDTARRKRDITVPEVCYVTSEAERNAARLASLSSPSAPESGTQGVKDG